MLVWDALGMRRRGTNGMILVRTARSPIENGPLVRIVHVDEHVFAPARVAAGGSVSSRGDLLTRPPNSNLLSPQIRSSHLICRYVPNPVPDYLERQTST